jgi:acyl-CoA thioester hydrolase
MPAAVHTATFRVRHYECDAYGHLNNANYARYMQEAAFDASAAVGYGKDRYESMGFLWLAHETDIEFLMPVRYGDTVEVRTWVGDFRRVRSRRYYEFRLAGQPDLVASASTDWVYIEAATERPAIVPPDMIAAFAPGGLTEEQPARPRFPAPPAPPPDVYSTRRRVEWRDIDTAKHVNNAVYLNYIEDAALQVSAHYGWPQTRCDAAGFAVMAREHHIEYKHPAMLDDDLQLTTWAAPHSRTTAHRYTAIQRSRDGVIVAQARTLWVWFDLKSSRPMRIQPELLADFAPNMIEPPTT